MADRTAIEWADASWSPVTGCTPISAGCEHCWAKRMAQRLRGRFGYPQDDPFAVTLHPDKLDVPLHWVKPRRAFTVSMGDLFHEAVPERYLMRVFGIMDRCRKRREGYGGGHTFLVLTKRPERMHRFISQWWESEKHPEPALSNLWLGVTAENQEQADKRIPVLLQTPAAKRWVSIEPCLSAVDLTPWLGVFGPKPGSCDMPVLKCGKCNCYPCDNGVPMPGLDLVHLGGESGPGARPLHPDSVRSVRDQCVSAGVPFLFKQWGAWFPRDQWEHSPELVLPDDDVAYQQGPRTHIFPDGTAAHCIGKKRAGRLLDGR